MNYLKKMIVASAFFALANTAFASPSHLITSNQTNHGKVYAQIGKVKSNDPVAPQTTRNREWSQVKILCMVQNMPTNCSAEIIVEHDLSHQRESLGIMSINLSTGELTAKDAHPSAHYTMNIIGNAHVEVTSTGSDF